MEHRPSSPGRPFPPPRRVFSAPIPRSSSTKEVHANSSLVETLYMHPDVRIISFTAPSRVVQQSTEASREEAGTLPWSSELERTIAVGTLKIYRAPGSVAFLSCGSVLQPILRKSQCWCIDESNSIFVLQVRRPNYWRIEVPKPVPQSQQKSNVLRDVFDNVLQFEKTWCPFQRTFFIEVSEESKSAPKKPWTPVNIPTSLAPNQLGGHDLARAHHAGKNLSMYPQPRAEGDAEDVSACSRDLHVGQGPDAFTTSPASPSSQVGAVNVPIRGRFDSPGPDPNEKPNTAATVADIVNDIDSRSAKDVLDTAPLTPGTEQSIVMPRSAQALPNTLDVSGGIPPDMQLPRIDAHGAAHSPTKVQLNEDPHSGINRRSTLPARFFSDSSSEPIAALDEASGVVPSAARSRSSSRSSSSLVMPNSLVRTPSPPFSNSSSGDPDQPDVTITSGGDIQNRRIPGAWVSSLDLLSQGLEDAGGRQCEVSPQYEMLELESEVMGITSDSNKDLREGFRFRPLRVNTDSTQRNAVNHGTPQPVLLPDQMKRYRSPMTMASKIPLAILTKTCEMLLGPPSHLITLILKVAARIAGGEWRGQADGVGENGEYIPVHWDYSDDELSGVDEESYQAANERKLSGITSE